MNIEVLILTMLMYVGALVVLDKIVSAIKSHVETTAEFDKIKARALSERIVTLYKDGRISFNELMECKKKHDWLNLVETFDADEEHKEVK